MFPGIFQDKKTGNIFVYDRKYSQFKFGDRSVFQAFVLFTIWARREIFLLAVFRCKTPFWAALSMMEAASLRTVAAPSTSVATRARNLVTAFLTWLFTDRFRCLFTSFCRALFWADLLFAKVTTPSFTLFLTVMTNNPFLKGNFVSRKNKAVNSFFFQASLYT